MHAYNVYNKFVNGVSKIINIKYLQVVDVSRKNNVSRYHSFIIIYTLRINILDHNFKN